MRFASRALLALLPLVASACISDRPAPLPRAVPPGTDGSFRTWWSPGVLKEEGRYLDGLRHGDVRGYHSDGSLAFEGRFERGAPVGTLREYAEGGRIARVHDVQPGAEEGVSTDFWPDGTPRMRAPLRRGALHGLEQRWHANGVLAREGRWIDGVPVGRFTDHDEQGRLVNESWMFRTAGQPAGWLETRFDDRGRPLSQALVTLVGGVPSGHVSIYREDGRVASRCATLDGRREGLASEWDEQGVLRAQGAYRADLKHGTWRSWDAAGRLVEELEFVDGERVVPQG